MLHQKRSGSLARLKYLLAVPLCAGLLCESTLGFSKTYGIINIGNTPTTIVTDTVLKKKLPPPPPPQPPLRGNVEKVTHVKATKNHPAVTVTDVKLDPPPPPPLRTAKSKGPVKFPPPIVREDKPVKFPPPIVKKSSSTKEIRIDETPKKTTDKEIRVEQ